MAEKTKTHAHESTLNISEEDLQSSLKDFLETGDEKEKTSIWNIRTISGLAFVFIALAFVGQSIGEMFGTSGLSLLNTLIGVTPYIAGAILAVISIGFLKQSGQSKKAEMKEEEKNKQAYDKLDAFLYADQSSGKSKRKKKESFTSIKTSSGLAKSRTDSKLFGVCGGVAKYLGINSTLLRIGFLMAFFLSSGSFFLLYLAMAFVMPKESINDMDDFN